jgi:transposase
VGTGISRWDVCAGKKRGQEIGLTRHGKGTKIMLAVDGHGTPLGVQVASAQKAEVQLAESTLATIRVPRKRGRARSRPKEVVADRAYDSQPLRQRLRRRGIRPCIPERRGKRPRRGPKPSVENYRHRWIVERTFAWLGSYRRVLTRHERLAHVYHAFVLLAFILICLARLLK